MFKKLLAIMLLCTVFLTSVGCGQTDSDATDETAVPATEDAAQIVTNLPKLDMSGWCYDEDYDLYYKAGIVYCEKPADTKYEQLAIFVPGAFMDGAENSDGSYSCELNKDAEINGYTADTAPIVMTVETPSYFAAEPITQEVIGQHTAQILGGVTEYTSQGVVYVYPACRGVLQGAPSGVTDLKAAVRYLRYCDDVIAGDAESIFVNGMSGGGAQAAVLGASGDSELYDPYLKEIGAVEGVSDAVAGSMDWCPVTDLNTGNAAYEWMMGCTRTGASDEMRAISDKLAAEYAKYVNGAGFVDEHGVALTLAPSREGIYQLGAYYDYLKRVIENSLNNYLVDTTFTNGTAEDYINGLNKDKKWISYDKSTNTATITSIADFVSECKRIKSQTFAFDPPQTRNTLFGYGDHNGSHFDRILTDVLTELNVKYAPEYAADLEKTDRFGATVDQRVDMYAPLYYLLESQDGYGTSKVAKYWRIRSGIKQVTNALTTEVNLALALNQYDGVESVDFETVWEKDHTLAERSGDPYANFIEWVHACMKSKA